MIRIAALLIFAGVIIAAGGVAGYYAAQISIEAPAPAPPQEPVPNQAGKSDRLVSSPFATRLPAIAPGEPPSIDALRQGFAPGPADSETQEESLPEVPPLESPPLPSPRPRGAELQKSYTLLSDLQIDAIKERLQLSPAQAKHWPAVEEALRGIARKMHALKQANAAGSSFALSQDAPEMQRLRTAAAPLLARLRDDQKREVRNLARIIGLDAVASRI